jgi:hypothetical protein
MIHLPRDIQISILSYLQPHDIGRLAKVCKAFDKLSYDRWLWKNLVPELNSATIIHSSELVSHIKDIRKSRENRRLTVRVYTNSKLDLIAFLDRDHETPYLSTQLVITKIQGNLKEWINDVEQTCAHSGFKQYSFNGALTVTHCRKRARPV